MPSRIGVRYAQTGRHRPGVQGEGVLAHTDVEDGVQAGSPQQDEGRHRLGLAVAVDQPAAAAACLYCSFQPSDLVHRWDVRSRVFRGRQEQQPQDAPESHGPDQQVHSAQPGPDAGVRVPLPAAWGAPGPQENGGELRAFLRGSLVELADVRRRHPEKARPLPVRDQRSVGHLGDTAVR